MITSRLFSKNRNRLLLKRSDIVSLHSSISRGVKLKNVKFNSVVFYKCGDIHPIADFSFSFENVKEVHAVDCDKNFVYYWLSESEFPNMRKLYLSSHPCEPGVLNGFQNINTTIYLSNFFDRYKNRWADTGKPMVKIMDHNEMHDMAFDADIIKIDDVIEG